MTPRTEYCKGLFCVEANWLYENDHIMTFVQYRYLVEKKKIAIPRRGGNGRTALVVYDSLPDRFKCIIVEKHGNIRKVTQEMEFIKHIQLDDKAITFYSNVLTAEGANLKLERQIEYYWNASILNAITSQLMDRKSQRKARGSKTTGLFSDLVGVVANLNREVYPHTLPASERRLKDTYDTYLEDGYLSLVHGGLGNNNSRVVNKRLEWLILSLYCANNKPYGSWVHEDYLQFVAGVIDIVDMKTGELFDRAEFWDEKKGTYILISEATVRNYINNPKNAAIIDSFRSTNHQYISQTRPHYSRHNAEFGLSKISLDDRDLPRKTHSGERVKAYYAYDVASGVLLGTAYSMKKDKNLFIECIRDLFRNINSNGWGMPMEVEVEHHLVKEFKDDLMQAEVVFPMVTWCAPGNSQEKAAEQFNRQKKYGYEKRHQDGIGRWYALSKTNRTGGERVYDDNTNKYVIKEQTYSYEELVADDKMTILEYNNGLHRNQKKYKNQTRMQVLSENLNPKLAHINQAVLVRHIGNMTKTSIQRNMYCRVKYNKYILPSPEILGRLSPGNYNVRAYWLPDNMDEVYLYQNGDFLAKCEVLKTFNTAKSESTEADKVAMVKQAQYIAKFDKMIKDGRQEIARTKLLKNLSRYDTVEAEVTPGVFIDDDEPISEGEYIGFDEEYLKQLAVASL